MNSLDDQTHMERLLAERDADNAALRADYQQLSKLVTSQGIRLMEADDIAARLSVAEAETAALREQRNDAWADAELSAYFNENGRKYAVTWDHLGDAYDEYEALADAYLKLRKGAGDST